MQDRCPTCGRSVRTRSNAANAYWWGRVVPAFQELWSSGRKAANLPPYTPDDTHEVLVQVLLGFEDGPLPGTRIRKRTRTLTTKEFAELTDKARHMALHDYGRLIPEAGEPDEQS